MEEPLGERAISIEASCSNRRNPFEDSTEQSSRKRQRISRGGSRSLSADASTDSETISESMLLIDDLNKAQAVEPPSTPARLPSESVEPTSRVTINLRTRPLISLPSSPDSPTTPSKMSHGGADGDTRTSVESESDALSTIPAIETPSTSSSSAGSPPIEVVTVDDDDSDELSDRDAAVTIISDDVLYMDPLKSFPYWSDTETLCGTVLRLARFFQYDEVTEDAAFCKITEWIESVLTTHVELDTFTELFDRNHEFWLELPSLIWGLNHRSKFFGEFLKHEQKGRDAFSEMMCQFARLTGKFVAMDVYVLASYVQKDASDRAPDLGSKPYLLALGFLLRRDGVSHIGINLNRHYDWDWDRDILAMSDHFKSEGGDVTTLTRLVEGKLKLMSIDPKIIEDLTDPCRLIVQMIVGNISLPAGGILTQPCTSDDLGRRIKDGNRFFIIMSAGLAHIIEKHLTFLSTDAANTHLGGLMTLYEFVLNQKSQTSNKIFANQSSDLRVLAEGQWPKAVALEWKFGILKKLIMSSQMQLRVVGVTTMCADLLSIFNAPNLKGRDPATSRFLSYFANFVLRNELIDYLVGIGSHPELIGESWNILGFLVVTRTYTEALTDKIWQTVMMSQDPRVVEAILKMVSKCFNLYAYDSLMYVCKKLMDLPIERFSSPMREFCTALFKDIVAKAHDSGIFLPIGPPPYDLLIRLVKLSSANALDASTRYAEVFTFAMVSFKEFMMSGPSDEHRSLIYRDCLSEISAKTGGSAGAISIITAMIRPNPSNELRKLPIRHGLTQMLIEELELVSMAAGSEMSNQAMRNTPAYQACRELLACIIIHEPASISPELGRRLWDVLVGSKTKTMSDRSVSWQFLNNALKRTSFNNSFLSSCFSTYMPTLPAYCFTQGALDFAREAVQASLTEIQSHQETDDLFSSAAIEQIWRMVLTAPPNTIDASAIGTLVDVFVNSPFILSIPRSKARTIHLALVNRCLQQLKGAAAKLKSFGGDDSSASDEAMAIVASDGQVLEEEKMFARSLAVLREFLRAYQVKPQFATPKSRAPIVGVTSDVDWVEGEPLTVKYQSFDGDKHTEVKSITLGKLNTAASLFASLQKATGFTNYKVYCSGKEFDPDEVDVCRSLEDLKLNGLVLVQRREEADGLPAHLGSNKPTLEAEITKHFDDLWGYLSMDEKVAQEIYYFLQQFPVYAKLTSQFETDTPHSLMFPAGQPYKILYAIHALRQYLYEQTQKVASSDASLSRSISIIVAAICDEHVLDGAGGLKDHIALQMINCLTDFLKEPLLPASITECLDDRLLKCLLQFLHGGMRDQTTQNSAHLVWTSFEAILEASTHSPGLWISFSTYLATSPLLAELILLEPRPIVRKSVIKQIITRCTFSPSLAKVSTSDFVATFWPLMLAMIPKATLNPYQCEETFSLALNLFRILGENSIEYLDLNALVAQWGSLLLSHTCVENTNFLEGVDVVAHGLAHLLSAATTFAKLSSHRLLCGKIGTKLFQKHMFPELSLDDEDGRAITSVLPLLNANTRHALTDAIFQLVKDDQTEYEAVLIALSHLVPYTPLAESPYTYEMTWQFDRSKSIRSHTGYVGLKNLSNTCYLNSLFTQLFMNIPFREFMLSYNVAEGASQKLLTETQNLFSNMQNSLKRFVDPSALAGSIRTYEETPIDVSIQMDVDEFYNLLFDRWESQILAEDAKKQFRTFYGGQLVQQVKSKECQHISERLEPFSAIQCDIKGKTCLQESLQAYVDGEIMEGDNKYKCSTCDRHVDAVKRACLKDVPDNLIFHLKRFDFNIQRMQRSKINDRFTFPTKIDMRPYKVEYLMDNPEDIPEDIFELVGVLVHSGTAESGHYYSYIRERPSSNDGETWVEFNDDCVSSWDPSNMESSCFGGTDYRGPLDGAFTTDKSWSAYMLFYQRSSVVAAQKETLTKTNMSSPVRLPVPVGLANHIAMENELSMRRYCLYDPSHAPFVIKMLDNMKNINKGSCGDSHRLEKLALTTSLNHLDQVIGRARDLPDFNAFMLVLKHVTSCCPECSRDYLEWYCDCHDTIRHLLLRNPEGSVRNEVAQSIMRALRTIRSDAPYAYGFGDDQDGSEELEGQDPKLIQRLVAAIASLWEIFHTNCRAWPEYFGLLADIGSIGKREAALLLDTGYLLKTLTIVSAEALTNLSTQYVRMCNLISKRANTTRPVSFESVISLLSTLMRVCDPCVDMVPENEARFPFAADKLPIPFTHEERHLLSQHWLKSNVHILTERLLLINQNDIGTGQIIRELLRWQADLDPLIFQTIITNIRKPTNSAPREPFISAALLYCGESCSPVGLTNMTQSVTRLVQHSDNGEGAEFLRFFENSFHIRSSHCELSGENLLKFRLKLVCEWAPCLLTNYETVVRHGAEDFLIDIFSKAADDVDPDDPSFDANQLLIVAAQKLGIACLDYLNEQYIRQRRSPVRSHFGSIEKVMNQCYQFYSTDSKDTLTRRYNDLRERVMPMLKRSMVDEPEEEASEWEGSDADYDESSEILDIGEFNGEGGDTPL